MKKVKLSDLKNLNATKLEASQMETFVGGRKNGDTMPYTTYWDANMETQVKLDLGVEEAPPLDSKE
ncbi:hypothetical protein ACE193_23400 [Bernardetia sp. OM2101]|uniref:hypothetical protein n=1 Tax=Bernardetia sp. OM2101 TaxID=3344876 RepID=UPI0035D0A5AF